MSGGRIGCIATPAQGNLIPEDALYACDNGKFGKGWPGAERWFAWLEEMVNEYGAERCLWATAPDVPFDAAATLVESGPWLARIRELGVPVAFAAQGGSERPGMIPWDDIDVLFLAGGVQCHPCGYEGRGRKDSPSSSKTYCPYCNRRIFEWKLSTAAANLAREAIARGKRVHMGRVNSEKRLRHAVAIGCTTADGTYLTRGPDKNLARLLSWDFRLASGLPPSIDLPLFDYDLCDLDFPEPAPPGGTS